MGQAKREMMKWQELGCRPVGDKFICPNCVEDYALKEFIEQHASNTDCDYCNQTYDQPVCAEANALIEHIAESISYEYEDPVHSVGYCSAEGGYLLPTMDSSDLLCDFELGEFHEDASNALHGLWVEKDPYGDRPWEHMLSSWGAFADHVKHQQRFFFPRAPSSSSETPSASILDEITQIAFDAGIIRTVATGTQFFRARQHPAGEIPTQSSELGTPPTEIALASNRMSPAGIPMFYAADDLATARAETEVRDPTKAEMTVGLFVVNTELHILDLADLPSVPSLFDEKRRHLRTGLKFIRAFADELALPIDRDGREHIEYIPTQMVSEYIRTVLKLPNGSSLDGIRYRSSKNPDGICVCLFLAHADFTGDGPRTNRVPTLQSIQTFNLDPKHPLGCVGS